MPGSRGALIAATPADVRDIMVEGESGILAVSPSWFKPVYEPSLRRLTWPNGSIATCYSAFEYEHLRGPQHHWAWCEELATWKKLQAAWDMMLFGLRLGTRPRCFISTTPKPLQLIRNLLKDKSCAVTVGTTYDNAAFLAKPFLTAILSRYEGTTLGQQEIYGLLLDDLPGALWKRALIERCRVKEGPELTRIVIGVDPPGGGVMDDAAEAGIVAAGKGIDGDYYVFADISGHLHPEQWGRRTVRCYQDIEANLVVGEVNNGGDMVEHVIKTAARDLRVPVAFKAVRASRGKKVRAEPIAALYEQGHIHHVGLFAELEDQLCTFDPELYDGSPDRLDALVWAVWELSQKALAPGLEKRHKVSVPRRT